MGYGSVLDQERIDLAKHRLATSADDYSAAVVLLNDGHYKAANNRIHFAEMV
jgi:hypothetical protein